MGDNPHVFQMVEAQRQKLLRPTDPRCQRYALAESPGQADIILFIQDYKYKNRNYVDNLLDNPLLRKYPEKCFAFDHQPEPPALLPGVYTSLPRHRMDPRRFRPGCYLEMYNTRPQQLWLENRERDREPSSSYEPRYLFSFRGNVNPHPVRRAIVAADLAKGRSDVSITVTDKWYDHDASDKDVYAREMFESKFVLCPRGIATSSYRLYETMALGRVPVILSDEWVPPSGVVWSECAVWVAESRVSELPEIIASRSGEWREMGVRARCAWESMFSSEVVLYWTLRSIEELLLFRSVAWDERLSSSQWRSWSFAWENGWTLPQKVYGAFKSGTARERIQRKIREALSSPGPVPPPESAGNWEGFSPEGSATEDPAASLYR